MGKDSNLTLIQKELQMHQLWDKGGAHISSVFYENELGLAPRFQMDFRDVISKQKATQSPEQSALSLYCWTAVTAPSHTAWGCHMHTTSVSAGTQAGRSVPPTEHCSHVPTLPTATQAPVPSQICGNTSKRTLLKLVFLEFMRRHEAAS